MAADFTKNSNFNKNNNFVGVSFGANSNLLEVELNESQDIQKSKLSQLIATLYSDSLVGTGIVAYTAGTLTIDNDTALVGGKLITIDHLILVLAEGETAYLDTWEQTLNYTSIVPVNGNTQSGATVPNTMLDARISSETSRRIQRQYALTKTTGIANHEYLSIGTVIAGIFNITYNRLMPKRSGNSAVIIDGGDFGDTIIGSTYNGGDF
jgi:hypothetical protein